MPRTINTTSAREDRPSAREDRLASRGMFSSLGNRDYRYLWFGTLCSSFAMNMQMVARGWLVYAMTESATKLAWVMLSFMVPQFLFSVFGGALADRLPKKRLIIFCQVLNFITTAVLAVIIITDRVTFWDFIWFGVFNGTVLAFMFPARNAVVPEIVGERQLLNAMALNTASMSLARIVGPALAGLIIALVAAGDTRSTFGVGVVYLILASLYIVSALTLLLVRHEGRPHANKTQGTHILTDIAEGFRYVRDSPVIYGLVLMSIVPFMFGMPLQSLMPAFNHDILAGGPQVLGFLTGAMGFGAIIGSLVLARLGDVRRKGLLMFSSCAAWGVGIGLFSLASTLAWAIALVALVGFCSSGFSALNRSLIQLSTAQEMRGRIMSIDMMAHGLMPLGIIPISILAETTGIDWALMVSGALLTVATLLCAVWLPDARKIDRGYAPLEPVSR